MASVGSSLLPASALLTTPFIVNYALTLANTEYTVTLPIGTRQFCMQARGQTTLKIRVVSASADYYTLLPFNPYSMDSVTGSSTIVLYVESTKANQVLEVAYWT